jgi:hypothetical protein
MQLKIEVFINVLRALEVEVKAILCHCASGAGYMRSLHRCTSMTRVHWGWDQRPFHTADKIWVIELNHIANCNTDGPISLRRQRSTRTSTKAPPCAPAQQRTKTPDRCKQHASYQKVKDEPKNSSARHETLHWVGVVPVYLPVRPAARAEHQLYVRPFCKHT